jgi:transcriptional regulator with XRE-family HTH domain
MALLRQAPALRQGGYQDFCRLPRALGDRLHEARLDARLTVTQAARRAGISPGYMSRLERGERCPRFDVARRLARALWLDDDLAQALIDAAADESRWT